MGRAAPVLLTKREAAQTSWECQRTVLSSLSESKALLHPSSLPLLSHTDSRGMVTCPAALGLRHTREKVHSYENQTTKGCHRQIQASSIGPTNRCIYAFGETALLQRYMTWVYTALCYSLPPPPLPHHTHKPT